MDKIHIIKVGIPGVCNEKSTKLWINKININKTFHFLTLFVFTFSISVCCLTPCIGELKKQNIPTIKITPNIWGGAKITDIHKIYVNLGPGKFTSLRISLSIAKAISFASKAILVGFYSKDLINKNYKNLIKFNKNKSLIKPIYSS